MEKKRRHFKTPTEQDARGLASCDTIQANIPSKCLISGKPEAGLGKSEAGLGVLTTMCLDECMSKLAPLLGCGDAYFSAQANAVLNYCGFRTRKASRLEQLRPSKQPLANCSQNRWYGTTADALSSRPCIPFRLNKHDPTIHHSSSDWQNLAVGPKFAKDFNVTINYDRGVSIPSFMKKCDVCSGQIFHPERRGGDAHSGGSCLDVVRHFSTAGGKLPERCYGLNHALVTFGCCSGIYQSNTLPKIVGDCGLCSGKEFAKDCTPLIEPYVQEAKSRGEMSSICSNMTGIADLCCYRGIHLNTLQNYPIVTTETSRPEIMQKCNLCVGKEFHASAYVSEGINCMDMVTTFMNLTSSAPPSSICANITKMEDSCCGESLNKNHSQQSVAEIAHDAKNESQPVFCATHVNNEEVALEIGLFGAKCICNMHTQSDGKCDAENNNRECHWDGGDCCLSSCRNTRAFECGSQGYTCLDPGNEHNTKDKSMPASSETHVSGFKWKTACPDVNRIFSIRSGQTNRSFFPESTTARVRYFLRTPIRVLGGVLVTQQRATKEEMCSEKTPSLSELSENIDCTSDSHRSEEPFGVDPTFVAHSTLFQASSNARPQTLYTADELKLGGVPYGFFPQQTQSDAQHRRRLKGTRKRGAFEAGNKGGNLDTAPSITFAEGINNHFPVFLGVNVLGSRASRMMRYLREGFYIDEQTTEVVLRVVGFHPSKHAVVFIVVKFYFDSSGAIFLNYKIQPIKLNRYTTNEEKWRLVLEILVLLLIIESLVDEIREIFNCVKRGEFIKQYLQSLWNYIDWLNMILQFRLIWIWLEMNLVLEPALGLTVEYQDVYLNPQSKHRILGLDQTHFRNYSEMVEAVAKLAKEMHVYASLSACSVILMTFRVIKLLDFQPKLGLVTRTLSYARMDLFHFLLIFVFVMCSFALVGQCAFGSQLYEFSTFALSLQNCFNIILGEIDVFEDLHRMDDGLTSKLFVWLLIFMCYFLLINVLLAILVDAYISEKEAVEDSSSLGEDMFSAMEDFMRGLFQKNRCRKKTETLMTRMSSKSILHLLQKLMEASPPSDRQILSDEANTASKGPTVQAGHYEVNDQLLARILAHYNLEQNDQKPSSVKPLCLDKADNAEKLQLAHGILSALQDKMLDQVEHERHDEEMAASTASNVMGDKGFKRFVLSELAAIKGSLRGDGTPRTTKGLRKAYSLDYSPRSNASVESITLTDTRLQKDSPLRLVPLRE